MLFGSFVGSISGAIAASAWSAPHDHGSHQRLTLRSHQVSSLAMSDALSFSTNPFLFC